MSNLNHISILLCEVHSWWSCFSGRCHETTEEEEERDDDVKELKSGVKLREMNVRKVTASSSLHTHPTFSALHWTFKSRDSSPSYITFISLFLMHI